MNKTDKDKKNVKKCRKCGDTMGVDVKCEPVCVCQIKG